MKQETGIEQSMQHPRVEDFRSKERERGQERNQTLTSTPDVVTKQYKHLSLYTWILDCTIQSRL